MIQPANNRKQRVEILALLANMRYLNEMLDNPRSLDQIRLVQDLIYHPEHLLIAQIRKLIQMRIPISAILFKQIVNVLARLDRLEQTIISKR